MAEFGTSPEDRFKLTLLSIEKRFVELESILQEVKQKVEAAQTQPTQPEQPSDIEQRVSDVEDIIYVEQAGIEELKAMLEEKKGAAPEDVKKIVEPMINNFRNEIEDRMHNMHQTHINREEIQEIEDRIVGLENQQKILHHFKAEIENLKDKVQSLNDETVHSIVSEVSDLRIDAGREIRELKEKIGNAPLYADVQFLSNRVKDLKMTMDNLLNMKVEVDAKLLNLERNLAEGGGGSSFSASNLISEIDDTKKQLFTVQKRIAGLDLTIKNIQNSFAGKPLQGGRLIEMTKEIEDLYRKLNEIYAEAERKTLEINRLAPVNVDDKIAELTSKIANLENELQRARHPERGSGVMDDQLKEFLEKLILLETRVNVLETTFTGPQRHYPIVLE